MKYVSLITGLVATIAFVAAVFRPILVAHVPGEKRRIQLVDLFSLVALWQYALAFVLAMKQGDYFDSNAVNYPVGVALLALMTGVWLGLVSTMSRLGVQRASKRFVAVGIAVPAGVVATFVFFGSTIAVLFSLEEHGPGFKSSAMIWIVSTMTGAVCRAAMQWATRPDYMRQPDGTALD